MSSTSSQIQPLPLPMSKPPSSTPTRYSSVAYMACVILMLQNCMSVLVIRYSRQQGGPPYLMSWTIVISEILKVVVCSVLSYRERFSNPELYGTFSDSPTPSSAVVDIFNKVFNRSLIYISVPGILYALQNNLLFYALSHLEAVVFSLLSQFKIVTTAFFSVLILHRRLSTTQWFALALLLSGICFVQYDSMAPQETPSVPSHAVEHHSHSHPLSTPQKQSNNSLSGFLAVFALTITSAIAGVYFEKIVKGLASGPTSIWVSNIQLGLFGVVSGFLVVYTKDWDVFISHSLFYGFNWVVVLAIALHTFGGLITAAVVKYADNILKSFATSFSMVLASLISWFFLGIPLSSIFIAGALQVVVATHLYSTNPAQ